MKNYRWCIELGIVAFLAVDHVNAQEWTRFRGPNGTGLSPAKGIPSQWNSTDINWKLPLSGWGHSSPVLWGERVFLTSMAEDQGRFFVHCVDARAGKLLWESSEDLRAYPKHKFNSYASSTPAVDGERVYVCWSTPARYSVAAFDHDGTKAWERDLGPFASQHGSGISPILHEGKLILGNEQDGPSSILALDAKSGRTLWQTPRKSSVAAYSTPCLFEPPSGEPLLIFNSQSHGIYGVDPATGRVHWEYDRAFDKRSVSSPVVADGLLIGSCGSGGGGNYVIAVRPGEPGRPPEEAWTIRRSAPYVPTSVAVGGRLFLWSDGGIAGCVDARTGRIHWQERVQGNYFASPVWIEGRLFGVSSAGDVVVISASDQFEILGRNPLNEECHSTLAVAGGRLYARTVRHLFSIGGNSGSPGASE